MNQIVQSLIDKVDKLPEMSAVAVKAAKMLDDEDISVQKLAEVISVDLALTTHILKVCNSAHYGFSRKISSINEAIPKIGLKSLKSIIFLAVSNGVLKKELDGYDLAKGDLWRNAVTCAVYSRYLAEMSGYKDPETAFVAGLLRDIGKLILHESVKDSYQTILAMVARENIPFYIAEERIVGGDHCTIGAAIAEKWNFPDKLISSIKYHHSYELAIQENCADTHLIAIIHIADAITMMLGAGIGADGMMYKMDLSALTYLKVPQVASSVETLIGDLIELNADVESLIGAVNE
ncbi:MAG: HDOD domain-containing protein [bacterium]